MNLNSIFHLLASVTIIIFSIFVFIKNKKNIYFVFFGTAIFIWLFASFFEYVIKGLYKYTWGYYPKASFIGHPVFLLFFNSLFTMSIISIFLSFHSKTNKLSVTDNNKLKYLFIGSMIGTLGALDF